MTKSVISRLKPLMPILLVILGLVLISVAVGLIFVPAGLIAAGLSCFVLEWRLTS